MKYDESICNLYGMIRNWSCTCYTSKHIKANTTLIEVNLIALVETKTLDFFHFYENTNGR